MNQDHIWQPSQTIALLIGVLHWQDKTLSTYDPKDRQDQQLYNILLERGVLKENIIFLKDDAATLSVIIEKLNLLSSKSNEQSLFLFYYAGHGGKSDDGTKFYFMNYDCKTSAYADSCLSLAKIAEILKVNFKGKKTILTADCCYSGNLNKVADDLTSAGIETLVLSSASASNISTGAWTFTQSLNEILSGKPLFFFEGDTLSAKDAGEYIKYNMTYGESQLSNFYTTDRFPKNFILAFRQTENVKYKPNIGQYRMARWKDAYYKVRIIDQQDNRCKIHYIGWGNEWDEWRYCSELKDIKFKIYDINSKVKVEWFQTWYPAVILKREGIFHYIQYDGYNDSWNEWVTSDRIKTE